MMSETIMNVITLFIFMDNSGSVRGILPIYKKSIIEYVREQYETSKTSDFVLKIVFTVFNSKHKTNVFHVIDEQSLNELCDFIENVHSEGSTSLYDSLFTVMKSSSSYIDENNKQTLVFIATDGQDTCSSEYNSENVRRLFESKPELEVYYCRIGEDNHAEVAQNEVQNLFDGNAHTLSVNRYDGHDGIETAFRTASSGTASRMATVVGPNRSAYD